MRIWARILSIRCAWNDLCEETQGDWDIRCIRTETGNDPCQIFQG